MIHRPKDAQRHGPRDPAPPRRLQPRRNRRRRPQPDRPTGKDIDFLVGPGALVGSDHAGTAGCGRRMSAGRSSCINPRRRLEAMWTFMVDARRQTSALPSTANTTYTPAKRKPNTYQPQPTKSSIPPHQVSPHHPTQTPITTDQNHPTDPDTSTHSA